MSLESTAVPDDSVVYSDDFEYFLIFSASDLDSPHRLRRHNAFIDDEAVESSGSEILPAPVARPVPIVLERESSGYTPVFISDSPIPEVPELAGREPVLGAGVGEPDPPMGEPVAEAVHADVVDRELEVAAMPARPAGSTFRLAAKSVFMTWPQCSASRVAVLDKIVETWPELVYAVVCEEKHADGEPHLHAMVLFKAKRNFKSLRTFDSLTGTHGDYRSTRSVPDAIKYVKKDGQFVQYGKEPMAKGSRALEAVVARIREGADMEALDTEFPAFVFSKRKQIDDYIALQDTLREMKRPAGNVAWDPLLCCNWHGGNEAWEEVCNWLRENMGVVRKHRQKQLYLWGPTGIGKSLLVLWLKKFFSVFMMPHGKYLDGFRDGYDLCVCDEFNGCYTISWINEFTQGDAMMVEVKGGFIRKRKNVPVIFLSNRPLSEAYKATSGDIIDALQDRFCLVHVDRRVPGMDKWLE